MENDTIYVNEMIESYLKNKEEKYDLDETTVKSLFRTCIESVNPELPHSSFITKGIKQKDVSYSVKITNIKLNFGFALDMIMGINGVITEKKFGLIIVLLDVLRTFFSEAVVKLEDEDAYLIYLIHKIDYKKMGVSKQKIMRCIKDDIIAQEKKYFLEENRLEDSLGRLEEIHSIVLKNGYYYVTETVFS